MLKKIAHWLADGNAAGATGGRAKAPERDPRHEQVIGELRRHVVERSQGQVTAAQIDPDADLWKHGLLDSLTYVEFLGHIESRFGVTLSDHDISVACRTLALLAARVVASGKPGPGPT
jgi:acyl carrier protein